MGELILGPDYLFLACHHSKISAPPARAIYRAFILTRKRRGHVMDLDRQQTRREVAWGLKRGRVFNCTVPCARCGTIAWLGDWVKSADYRAEDIEGILRDNPDRVEAGLLKFLEQCPGGAYKRVGHTKVDWPEVL